MYIKETERFLDSALLMERLKELQDIKGVRKYVELFDDFDLLDYNDIKNHSSLEECIEVLNKRTQELDILQDSRKTKTGNDLKPSETFLTVKANKRSYKHASEFNKPVKYDDDKLIGNNGKNILSQFFRKK
jgi:hypothetical protein